MTVRLLAQYQGNPPNTIVTLAGGVETALVAAGNASTDLSGGVPPVYLTPANSQIGDVLYGPDGVPLGIADATGKLLLNFNGITVPGAPTGVALTPIAGGVLAAFTPSATLGGTVGTGFEVTLSNGRVQRGAASPIVVNSPAGAVTATVKQINGAGLSAASAASASATVTAYTPPAAPGAPTGLSLVAGNGKVTASWTAAAANGSAIRNTVVTLSNGASATALGSATTVDVATPNGTAVTATARASNGEGSGPVSAVSNSVVPAQGPAGTLRQAATGSFINETVDAANYHAGARLPFTAGVEIPAGTSLRVKFANKAVINNVETNSGGPLNLLAASMEYTGVCTAGTLTQATAAPGAIAFYDVVAPTTIPKGALFWLSYKISNGSGLARFPWYSHSTTNVSKQTISTTGAGVPDQTMVVGGGTWTAVTGGVQSFAIVPVAVEMVHAGKVAAVGGSSTPTGRSDQGAPGAGVQGYIARAIAGLGYPVKNIAVSGDRVVALAASDTFRVSQLEGVTHHVIVVGGNDITDGTTAAAMLAGYQSHINHIKAAWPSIKIMVLTLTPVVTGTYDTVGGQTVAPTNGVRISANTQIKANVLTGVDKVADINTLGENVFNPEDGKFAVVPGQLTNDGLHYNTLGCSTLSAHPAFAEFMAM